MKKILLLFAAALLSVIQLTAADVNMETARETAKRFVLSNAKELRFQGAVSPEMTLARTVMNSTDAQRAVLYIFNSSAGYVVVAGDDRAEEVLAYGDYSLDINNIPPGLQDMLYQYQEAIEYLQENPTLKVDPLPSPKNSRLLRGTTVGPLLPCNWDQDAPFWNECVFSGYQCYTGCPATSAAMVMYYWKYPTDPVPALPGYASEIEYSYWGSTSYNHAPLPSVTFDWDNMLDNYYSGYTAAQGAAVARLMHYVGHAERMVYGTSSAGGSGIDADSVQNIVDMYITFGYDPESVRMVKKTSAYSGGTTNYTDAEWAAILQEEMYAERPIVFCALSTYGGGHAFNVDGYNGTTNKYHVNYGWSGEDNDWFSLNAFNGYSVYQQAVIGIVPLPSGPTIKVSPSEVNMEAYVDNNSTSTFTVRGTELTTPIELTLDDPSGYFSLSATSVPVRDQENGKLITVTYAPEAVGQHTATVTLTNADAETKVVTLNGVATLDTHVPVMLPADSAHINLTEFRADWDDETDAKFVESYTLQVGAKPAPQLLHENDWSSLPKMSGNQVSNAQQYMPQGWVFNGSGLWLDGGCIEPAEGSTIKTCSYGLDGYDKVTVIVRFKNYSTSNAATLKIATSKETKTLTGKFSYADYTVVLDCDEIEQLIFTAGYYPKIQHIKIYAGELDEATLRDVLEEGDANSRIITGITDRHYVVKDLEPGGNFYYRVKAFYTDGTASSWSRFQQVTLFDNGVSYPFGDVNHSGELNIDDLTDLINYVLTQDDSLIYFDSADLDGNQVVNMDDVTDLINMLLNNN